MTAQLLLYRFGADAEFEGRLTGAFERLESGGSMRILDVLFVGRAGDGELAVFGHRSDGAGGVVGPMLDFRLNLDARRRATDHAMKTGSRGIPAATLQEIAETLPPGTAIAAVLVEHVWARALDDAVTRSGGHRAAGAFVDAGTMAECAPALLGAVQPGTQEVTGP
jgi:hypothetical protein